MAAGLAGVAATIFLGASTFFATIAGLLAGLLACLLVGLMAGLLGALAFGAGTFDFAAADLATTGFLLVDFAADLAGFDFDAFAFTDAFDFAIFASRVLHLSSTGTCSVVIAPRTGQ